MNLCVFESQCYGGQLGLSAVQIVQEVKLRVDFGRYDRKSRRLGICLDGDKGRENSFQGYLIQINRVYFVLFLF